MENAKNSFEETDFYKRISAGTEEGLNKALGLMSEGSVNVRLVSHQPGTEGWTFLHFVVDAYVFSSLLNPLRMA